MRSHPAAGRLELNQAVYSQRDAIFRGGEFQCQCDVRRCWGGFFGIEGQYDIVRATFTDGTNVPRIPPQRVGGGVYFRDANWLARVSLLHAFAQNDIAAVGETPTAGYNLLKAELSHTRELNNRRERHRARSPSAWSATTCSTRTSATPCPTPRTWC